MNQGPRSSNGQSACLLSSEMPVQVWPGPLSYSDAFEPHRRFDNGGLTLIGKGADL